MGTWLISRGKIPKVVAPFPSINYSTSRQTSTFKLVSVYMSQLHVLVLTGNLFWYGWFFYKYNAIPITKLVTYIVGVKNIIFM